MRAAVFGEIGLRGIQPDGSRIEAATGPEQVRLSIQQGDSVGCVAGYAQNGELPTAEFNAVAILGLRNALRAIRTARIALAKGGLRLICFLPEPFPGALPRLPISRQL